MKSHSTAFSDVSGVPEHRLCHFAGDVMAENSENTRREFENARRGGRVLADKYAASQDMRNAERVQQYNRLEQDLMKRFTEEQSPDGRAAAVREMKQIAEELGDALTRGMHNRVISRPNRFDTETEQKQVLRESADYHRFLRAQEQKRTTERIDREQSSREAEEEWQNRFLEVPYRLIRSGMGADPTISNSADKLLANIPLVKTVKGNDIPQLLEQIDHQIRNNSNLETITRKKLETLKAALK